MHFRLLQFSYSALSKKGNWLIWTIGRWIQPNFLLSKHHLLIKGSQIARVCTFHFHFHAATNLSCAIDNQIFAAQEKRVEREYLFRHINNEAILKARDKFYPFIITIFKTTRLMMLRTIQFPTIYLLFINQRV